MWDKKSNLLTFRTNDEPEAYYSYGQDVTSNVLPKLPRLFLDRGGISDVEVTFANGSSDDIKFTIDGYGYWWGGRGGRLMINRVMIRYPNYYNSNRNLLRAAFKVQGSPSFIRMIITGKMGGLRFIKDVTLQPDAGVGLSSEQWAFRYVEQYAQTPWNSSYDWSYWKALQDSIKAMDISIIL